MGTMLTHAFAALTERYNAERQAHEARQRIIDRTLWSLSALATDEGDSPRHGRGTGGRRRLDANADEAEMMTATREALLPVEQAVERRLLQERVLDWALWQLPRAKTELDAVRVRRECTEILAELSEDISEIETKEALESTIQEACQEIEARQGRQQRQARKAQLIEQGLAGISAYLLELKSRGEITAEEYFDADFTEHVRTAVRRTLPAELTGEESNKEVRQLVIDMIDAEIE